MSQALIESQAQRKQKAVLEAIRSQPGVTTHELVAQFGVSFRSMQSRLQRLRVDGLVVSREPLGSVGRWFVVPQPQWGRSVFELGASL